MAGTPITSRTIGVLALQGDFDKHCRMLHDQLSLKSVQVRTAAELDAADALILPGGESTTIAKLLARSGLDTDIRGRVDAGMPVYGTCAGMILLAREIEDRPDQATLGVMDITVARNAFGRQIESFEADIPFAADNAEVVRGVFIRAPYVTHTGPSVSVLSHFRDRIVAVRQGSMIATAFHPELTDNAHVHRYFARMVAESREIR